MNDLTNKLISWYLLNKRDLPWRTTTDPYKIWLSEIILQQTRVDQGMSYYYRFTEQYPNVESLAAATEDEVLKMWQGLGYYSRARNLHATAKNVAFENNGKFPQTYKALKKLKGVGDYTASAIASICFDEAAAVVDGNVYRVLSRIFGIETPINSSAGQKEFKALAQELIDKKDPATFNQAIMEFGAIQCKPKNPYCLHCPFNDRCVALKENSIGNLPVKKGKTKVRDRYLNYLVFILNEKNTLLQQRKGKGIWQGLYQFPLLESDFNLQKSNFVELAKNSAILADFMPKTADFDFASAKKFNTIPILHKLSHQNLYVTFWVLSVNTAVNAENSIPIEALGDYPIPRVIDRFLEGFDFAEQAQPH